MWGVAQLHVSEPSQAGDSFAGVPPASPSLSAWKTVGRFRPAFLAGSAKPPKMAQQLARGDHGWAEAGVVLGHADAAACIGRVRRSIARRRTGGGGRRRVLRRGGGAARGGGFPPAGRKQS